MPVPRPLLPALLVAASLLVSAAPASARLQIGISDQSPGVFAHRLFTPLHLRYARIVVPWNVARRHDYWPRYLTSWLENARRAHAQPHVAFGEPSYTPRLFGKGPSPASLRNAFRAFRRRWPAVRVFTPWNEATFHRAPTYRRPGLAARYYEAMRRSCPRCTILAADMLDMPNLTAWLRGFLRHVHGHPRLWGIHNYRDANRDRPLRTSTTLKLTRMVRGTIWVTESGGIAGLEGAHRRTAWRYSPARAGRSLKHLFALVNAPAVRRRYRRVYVYNFFGAWDRRHRTNSWDSGLIGLNGRPRPAYWALKGIVARLG